MSRTRRRARSAEEQAAVRRAFLQVARRVFAEEGSGGLTMRRIASEAGYSPGTIYLYFKNRQELIRDVWREDTQGLRDAVAAAREAAAVQDRLPAMLRAYADFWFARPDHFQAMFLRLDRRDAADRAAVAEDASIQEMSALFLQETREATARGQLREDDERLLFDCLLAAVHGVVALHLGTQAIPWADRDAMVDTAIEALMRGLRT